MHSEPTTSLREEYKKIADFLGFTYVPSQDGESKDPGWYRNPKSKNPAERELLYFSKTSALFITRKTLDLKFKYSWDSLMLVVNKIESISSQRYGGFKVTIEEDSCIIRNKHNVKVGGYHRLTAGPDKKEATYRAVLLFIEFWNSINKFI